MFMDAATTMSHEHLSQAGPGRCDIMKHREVSFYSFYEMEIFTRVMQSQSELEKLDRGLVLPFTQG